MRLCGGMRGWGREDDNWRSLWDLEPIFQIQIFLCHFFCWNLFRVLRYIPRICWNGLLTSKGGHSRSPKFSPGQKLRFNAFFKISKGPFKAQFSTYIQVPYQFWKVFIHKFMDSKAFWPQRSLEATRGCWAKTQQTLITFFVWVWQTPNFKLKPSEHFPVDL